MTISATTQGLRMGVATSTSRPTVPFDGQVISETDTDSLSVYNGTSWIGAGASWSAWTPTWTNLTVGNATQTARYSQSGKTVFFSLKLVLGSTSSVASSPNFTFPVTPASVTAAQASVVQVVYLDAGTAGYLGTSDPRNRTTTTITINAPSNTVQLQEQDRSVSSTVPFTWVSTDTIWVSGMYEAA